MSLAAGVRLGAAYEILAPLGAGGMGEVYRARDIRVGREVAIKILPAGLSSDRDRLQRFEQEARASASLNHPNILVLYDVGQHEGAPFIVSELLDGVTLRERIGGSPIPVRKAVDYAVQIAQGLAAAHEKAIVHRDLKPENIFITSDGRVKILDFGLAKLTQAEPALSGISVLPTTPPDTLPGVVLGTVGYMSPEQVRGHAADHRSDIFALGTVLYEMLSGRRAFHGETTMDAMSAILKEDPPDFPTSGERQIPPALARIVDRCLEKNPAARFQSTRDLAFALEGLSSHSGSVPAITAPDSTPTRGKLTWVAAGVATLGLIAALPLVITHLHESPSVPNAVRFTVAAPAETVFSGGPNPGIAYRPAQAVSPDGRHMVFLARRTSGSTLLWIRSLDALEARPLVGTDGANFPFWSPDSRSIGFFADGKLKKIEVSGGPPQTLCDAELGEGGTWNSDGVIVFAAAPGTGLLRVSDSGGEPTAVTQLDTSTKETSHRWPHFLPDRKRFIFLAQPGNEVRVGSLDSSETAKLLNADSKAMYAPPGYLLFVREQTLMAQSFDPTRVELAGDPFPVAEDIAVNAANGRAAFSVSESGILTYRSEAGGGGAQLTWFDRTGRQLAVIGERSIYQDLQLSPDGQRAVVTVIPVAGTSGADLWIFDMPRGLPSRLTSDPAADSAGLWSPDGARLVFSSGRKGGNNLYLKAATGIGVEESLLTDDLRKFPSSWSHDGRFVLYGIGAANQDLWLLPMFGDRKPVPFMQTPFDEFAGRFSPDGRWIAYRSNESGQAEIYVAPFPGPGEKIRISSTGAVGGYPRWRRDGKELFYLASDQTLMAAAVNGQGPRFEVGAAKPLFQTRPSLGRDPFDVSPDGQKFLILTTSQEPANEVVTVVLNWTASLKK